MYLLVFLGNIGKRYEKTRHNIGFLLADFLSRKWGFSEWQAHPKLFGEISEGSRKDGKILFLKPHTLMNLSGKALLAAKNFYKIPVENILVIYDDKDLPFGTIRYRQKGSSGGHKGMADCLRVLGSTEVSRLKLGIDTELRGHFAGTAEFVLAGFSDAELTALPAIFEETEAKIRELLKERSFVN